MRSKWLSNASDRPFETEILTNKQGAVGIEAAEMEGHFADLKDFNSISGQPFGTREKPINVLSEFEGRIVGCRGGPRAEDEHEILWHFVRQTKPTLCMECGQVFKLTRIGDHAGEHGEHGDHGHEHGEHEGHGEHGHSHTSHAKHSEGSQHSQAHH